MAQENIVKMQCSECKRFNFMTHKNKKKVERKLEFKKYCPWCLKHTVHKEVKK